MAPLELREAVIPLPDPIVATAASNAFFASELAGRRIVFVGEADHFIHEKADYRQMVLEALDIGRPWWLGEELAWSDGRRIERELLDGSLELDDVTLYGYRGDVRTDRDDRPTGILRPSFDRFPDPAFVAEHRRWLAGVRETVGRADGFRFFGFDVDLMPGGGYRDLGIDRPAGVSLAGEVAQLEALKPRMRAAMAPLDRLSLDALKDGFRYIDLAHPAPSFDALAPAMALRESVMHRQVDAIVKWLLEGDAGLMLFAHDLHLAKDDTRVTSHYGVGPGGDAVHSVGHHIAARHADDLYVIWMVCGGGEDSQPLEGLPRKLEPERPSLNATLGNVGGNFIVPTRGVAELGMRQRMFHLYNGYVDVVPAEQADALVFIERVSPLRLQP